MILLGTRIEYRIEILVNPKYEWSSISIHKTLDDARKRLDECKVRSILLNKECQFRIVMLEITESEVRDDKNH